MRHLIIFIITLYLINSCYRKDEFCEAFKTSRLPFDSLYYEKQLEYTNGIDTITLFPSGNYTKASSLNPIGNPICNPFFEIHYSVKTGNALHFLYSFSYYPDNDTTELYISFNENSITFDVDSTLNQKLERNDKVHFYNFNNYDEIDSTRAIKSIAFLGLRITEIEKLNGEKWKLIKVGNEKWKLD